MQEDALGLAWGVMLKFGAATWAEFLAYAHRPHTEARFWVSANLHYREWTVRFLVNALTVGV